ncbi:MAG: TetR/AcrR family transcriptional regulator [Candidatus Izimaplasma sp.]|nr:TetR/AcrR family transcriptional regulator [Candidatus Izimaplasma bacterium]
MKENKQVLRSKEWIFEALTQIMKNKKFQDISISEIAKKAGVARLTFYRNYNSKEDIIVCRGKRIYAELKENIERNDHGKNTIYSLIRKIVLAFNQYSDLFELLLRDNLDYLVMQSFELEISDILGKVFGVDNDDKYRVKFYEGALFAIAVEWVKNSRKESVDEMTNIIYKLV